MGCVCVDGVFTEPAAARVPALDHGVLFGDGVFETVRAYAGVGFRLEQHLERLEQTATAMEFPPLPSRAQLRSWIGECLVRGELADAHVRITLTRGVSARGWDPAGSSAPTVIISALPYRPVELEEGVSAVTLWSRSLEERPLPSWKTTSYQRSILGRKEAQRRGAYEGLFVDAEGHVLEGATSNVFAVVDGRLWTPEEGCLPGITRAEVLSIADERGLTVWRKPLAREALYAAEELFLTSSLAELVPVLEVDKKRIGRGAVGALTKTLRAAYRERVQRECPAFVP